MDEQRGENNSYLVQPSQFANEHIYPRNFLLSHGEIDDSRPQLIVYPHCTHLPGTLCFH